MNDAAGVLKPGEQRMRVVFQIQVRVLLAFDHVACERRAEQRREAEIRAAPAAFIAQ